MNCLLASPTPFSGAFLTDSRRNQRESREVESVCRGGGAVMVTPFVAEIVAPRCALRTQQPKINALRLESPFEQRRDTNFARVCQYRYCYSSVSVEV